MKNQNRQLVRIVPPPSRPNGLTLAKGTKVLVGDAEVPGVVGVTLEATVDGVWTATIRCDCEPPEVSAVGMVQVEAPLAPWRRTLLRLLGVRAIEVMNLGSETREWRTP